MIFPVDGQSGNYPERAGTVVGCRGLRLTPPEFGNIVPGVFTPVLAKPTKSFNLVDTLSVGVDRIQRNFEPVQRQVESWRQTQITDARAKLIFCSAFSRWQARCSYTACGGKTRRWSRRQRRTFRRIANPLTRPIASTNLDRAFICSSIWSREKQFRV